MCCHARRTHFWQSTRHMGTKTWKLTGPGAFPVLSLPSLCPVCWATCQGDQLSTCPACCFAAREKLCHHAFYSAPRTTLWDCPHNPTQLHHGVAGCCSESPRITATGGPHHQGPQRPIHLHHLRSNKVSNYLSIYLPVSL